MFQKSVGSVWHLMYLTFLVYTYIYVCVDIIISYLILKGTKN